jgi:hypothetical protein
VVVRRDSKEKDDKSAENDVEAGEEAEDDHSVTWADMYKGVSNGEEDQSDRDEDGGGDGEESEVEGDDEGDEGEEKDEKSEEDDVEAADMYKGVSRGEEDHRDRDEDGEKDGEESGVEGDEEGDEGEEEEVTYEELSQEKSEVWTVLHSEQAAHDAKVISDVAEDEGQVEAGVDSDALVDQALPPSTAVLPHVAEAAEEEVGAHLEGEPASLQPSSPPPGT